MKIKEPSKEMLIFLAKAWSLNAGNQLLPPADEMRRNWGLYYPGCKMLWARITKNAQILISWHFLK